LGVQPDARGETAPGSSRLASALRAEAVRAGGQVRRLTPAALASFLAAAALTPLLVPLIGGMGGGEVGAALTQLGGIGGGYLAGLLSGIVERARRSAREDGEAVSGDWIRVELAEVIQRELAAPGQAGSGLRGEVSAVLRSVDAIPAAMAADDGGVLALRLTELGEQFTEFGWVLDDLAPQLTEVQRTLVREGAAQRSHIAGVRGELDTITGLLQRIVAAQERAARAGAAAAPPPGGAAAHEVCPYPGLRPFTSRDARWFFGRQELTAHLLGRLGEQMDSGSPLFVLGPSGAGKSSLLQAGLIPALRDGLLPVPGSRRWPRLLVSRPGRLPLAALAEAVASRAGSPRDPLSNALDGDPDTAAAALAERLLRGRAGRLVLVVDQFEDIFSQCRDEAERLRFVRVLLALARCRRDAPRGAGGALVVISVRADFYADCAEVDELRPLLPDNQLMVGPLSGEELRLAITRPAADAGCAVEPGLTELMLSDLGLRSGQPGRRASYEPGALPLLGYALQATWERRTDRTLTVAGYRAAGGIHGAIANEAERIYQDYPPGTQQVVRRIMLRLVSVRSGAGAQQTRQRVSRAGLVAGLDAAEAGDVVARFTQARLVSADADGVEISHEAFLDAWPRLREWIAEDRAGLRIHRQIADDAAAWAEEGRDPGGLYRGLRLGNAQDWRAASDNDAELSELERKFLDASASAEAAEKDARERQRQRERRNRRLRALAGGLTVVVAVVLAAALAATAIAVANGRSADARRQQALADDYALQSDQVLGTNLGRADLLALAGWQEGHTAGALSSLLSRQADPYAGSFAMPSGYYAASLAVSPNRRLLAVGGQPGILGYAHSSVWLWSLATHRRLAVFRDLPGIVHQLAFSPDGSTLAAVVVGNPHSLRLWNVATRKALPNPTGDTGRLTALAYSPNGQIMAVARGLDHVIDLWDLASHRLVARLTGNTGLVWSVAFSPDGKTLASGDSDTTVRLWNAATGTRQAVLRGLTGKVYMVAFSPNGRILASASSDGIVRDWNVAARTFIDLLNFGSGDAPAIAFGHEDQYLYALDPARGQVNVYDLVSDTNLTVTIGPRSSPTQIASSPQGALLALGGQAGSLIALDEGRGIFYQEANSSLVSLAVSRGGRLVATGAANGTVQLWDPARPAVPPRVLRAGRSELGPVAFSPGGRLLAISDERGSVALWNVESGTRLAVLTHPSGQAGASVAEVEFSPDGKTLATYTLGGTAALWNVATHRRLAAIQAGLVTTVGTSHGLAYSPDGHTLAFAGRGGDVLLWNTQSHRVTGRINTSGQDGLTAIAFSPDGRLLATAGYDSTVRLWSAATGGPAGSVGPLSSVVRYLAFSPGGRTLATVGQDTSVQLWNVASGQAVATLSGHTQEVNAAAFTPDGRTLITASADGSARVWDLNPEAEVHHLCAVLQGPGPAAQWRALNPIPGPYPCAGG
jgi:WD40 repeat protein